MPPRKRPESVGPTLIVFWQHARRYKLAVFLMVFFGVASQVMYIIIPLFYKQLFDILGSSEGMPTASNVRELFFILSIIIGLHGVGWLLWRITRFASVYLQPRVMTDLLQTSFDYLLGHSYNFFVNTFTGSIVRKVNRIARSFEQLVNQVEFSFIPIAVSIVGIISVLFMRHPLLGSIFAAWTLLLLVVQYAIARWKQKYNLALAEKDSRATGVLSDSLTNATTVKLFSGQKHERSLYQRAIEEVRVLRFRTWSIDEWVNAIQGALAIAIEFGLLYAAIILWRRGIITVGDFALIQAYIVNAVDKLWYIGGSLRRTYEALAEAQEMIDILNVPYEVRDKRGAKKLVVTRGEIEFRHVVFSFHKTRRVLDGFTLAVAGKEKVAFVGSSGAGKSTITQLLFRFHDLEDGEVLIDGQNIARVTQESLRNSIAFVPQEPILFHRTLEENIRYGRLDASDEEVVEAAKKAHAHEFISSFPDGYDTYVGERGVKLSGGERQRVAIARAILKDAPILVLDEATSSLDSESEALIQNALAELMKEKTVIVIAHRLSTIRRMNRIIVIEEGRAAASGTHEELLQEQGVYKNLWETQVGGFIR